MVKECKTQLSRDFSDVISYLKPHKLPKNICKKPTGKYFIHYSLKSTAASARASSPTNPRALKSTTRMPKMRRTSRKTVPKSKKPIKRLIRTAKPATALRKRAETVRSYAKRQVAAGSEREESADELNQTFLRTVDSLELIRVQFQSRGRAGQCPTTRSSSVAGSGDGNEGDGGDPPTLSLAQFVTNYFSALWPDIGLNEY